MLFFYVPSEVLRHCINYVIMINNNIELEVIKRSIKKCLNYIYIDYHEEIIAILDENHLSCYTGR